MESGKLEFAVTVDVDSDQISAHLLDVHDRQEDFVFGLEDELATLEGQKSDRGTVAKGTDRLDSHRMLQIRRDVFSELKHFLGGCEPACSLEPGEEERSLAKITEIRRRFYCIHSLLNDQGNKIRIVPKDIDLLQSLKVLELSCDDFDIQGKSTYLPSSICALGALTTLCLQDFVSLRKLPKKIGNLQALKELDLQGCEELQVLPDTLGDLRALETLNLSGCTSLRVLPDTFGGLQALKMLNLQDCVRLEALPDTCGDLQLECLNVRGCASLDALPEALSDLPETLEPACDSFEAFALALF